MSGVSEGSDEATGGHDYWGWWMGMRTPTPPGTLTFTSVRPELVQLLGGLDEGELAREGQLTSGSPAP